MFWTKTILFIERVRNVRFGPRFQHMKVAHAHWFSRWKFGSHEQFSPLNWFFLIGTHIWLTSNAHFFKSIFHFLLIFIFFVYRVDLWFYMNVMDSNVLLGSFVANSIRINLEEIDGGGSNIMFPRRIHFHLLFGILWNPFLGKILWKHGMYRINALIHDFQPNGTNMYNWIGTHLLVESVFFCIPGGPVRGTRSIHGSTIRRKGSTDGSYWKLNYD